MIAFACSSFAPSFASQASCKRSRYSNRAVIICIYQQINGLPYKKLTNENNENFIGIEVSTDAPKSKETRNEIFDTSQEKRKIINKSSIPHFGFLCSHYLPKAGTKLLLIIYLLSWLMPKISFLVSLLFGASVDTSIPTYHLNF